MGRREYEYGSAHFLKHFFAQHKRALNNLIRAATGASKKAKVEWLLKNPDDFGDEWRGVDCFKDCIGAQEWDNLGQAWKEFWPKRSTGAMNWDGLFKIDDVWYFVEAKARKCEFFQHCGAKRKSQAIIGTRLNDAAKALGADSRKWIGSKCYQLANRLAFLRFCKEHGIKAKGLYVCFLNGFKKPGKDESIKKDTEWQEIWREGLVELGLKENALNGEIYHVYPDCEDHYECSATRDCPH